MPYRCNRLLIEGLSPSMCMSLCRAALDEAMGRRALEVMQSAQIEIALQAMGAGASPTKVPSPRRLAGAFARSPSHLWLRS